MKTSYHVPPLVRTFARISTVTMIASSALSAAELKYTLAPEAENFQLGSKTIALGDLNDDGIPEIAVADQSYISGGTLLSSGIVYVINGADGETIHTFQGTPARFQSFGFALAALNADGDGIADLAIGAIGQTDAEGVPAGAVWIYSGDTGEVISTTLGPAGSSYGSSLANAGDQDGDGMDDLFVGASSANGNRGSVSLQSSADGSTLWSVNADFSRSSFGASVVALDDLDGDTFADFAVAAPDFRGSNNESGRVQIYRSSDRQLVAEKFGSDNFQLLGFSMAEVDDANEDGWHDLMVGSYNGGTCLVLSGTDLSLIADLSISGVSAYRPMTAGGGFDADGDGISDWLLGSPGLTTVEGMVYGGVRILSGADSRVIFSLDSTAPNSGLGRHLSVLPHFGVAMGDTLLLDPETNGYGSVQIWEFQQFDSNPDSDGDGVTDDVDVVINSDVSPTIVLFGVDSGVENTVDAEGRTLADRFSRYADPKSKRRAVRYFLRIRFKVMALQRRDLISRTEARALNRAALRGVISLLRKR